MIVLTLFALGSQSDRDFMVNLYRDYERLMFATVKKYVSNSSDQEDLVQFALEKLMAKISTLKSLERCTLASYIVYSIRNTAINHLNHQSRTAGRCSSFEDDLPPNQEADILPMDDLLILKERASEFRKVWPKLPDEDRVLLSGKYILGYTDQEIALQLGCKASSIRMKLTRARRNAFQYLRENEVIFSDET